MSADLAELLARRDDELVLDGRAPRFFISNFAVLAVLAALSSLRQVEAVVGVGFRPVAIVCASMAVTLCVGTVILRTRGARSRAFRAAHAVEFTAIFGGPLALVYLSGRAVSPFWMWSAGIALINTRFVGYRAIHAPLILGLPGALAIAFAARGSNGDAATSVMLGLTIYAVYDVIQIQTRAVARMEHERAVFERELAERRRLDALHGVARDLHDGLGASLTTLLWRARGLARKVASEGERAELEELVEVAGDALDELRTVVVGMRSPVESWRALVAELRARTARLCGDRIALVLRDELDAPDERPPARLAAELPRFVLEAARNAIRHGDCTKIEITVESRRGALTVSVVDDGRGLTDGEVAASAGGLVHLRERARALGGTVTFDGASSGTRVALAVPHVHGDPPPAPIS